MVINFNRFALDPAEFRAELLIPGARGPAKLSEAAAPFQRQALEELDKALLALMAAGVRPAIGRHFWEWTKGCGKDTLLAVALLWLLAFSRRLLTCQVGAADQDQAAELLKAARQILHLNPWLAELITVQASALVNPRTESRADIIPADVAGSHGARPDLLILNELTHIDREEFAKNLLDNAAKVPNGVVVIATNAGFIPSFAWDLREIARTSDRWYFSQVTEPAPWLDPAEIREAERRNPPSRFRRLFKGEWLSSSGDAISEEDLLRAVTEDRPMDGSEPDFQFFAGLDLSISRDACALVTVGRHKFRRLQLASCRRWLPAKGSKVNLMEVEEAVLAVHKRFKPLIGYDVYQAELMAQRCKARGVRMQEVSFQGQSAMAMASEMIEVFTSGRIALYHDTQLLRDIRKLRIIEKPSGWRLDAPRTSEGHSDSGIALAIAVLMARDNPVRKRAYVEFCADYVPPEPEVKPDENKVLTFAERASMAWGPVGGAEASDMPGEWTRIKN